MKKILLFSFLLLVGNVKGQTYYPCNSLSAPLVNWCFNWMVIDTLSFEEDSSLIKIDTSSSINTWSIGHSYKPFFDSATSPYGFITDTLMPYQTNLKSSFTLKHPLAAHILFFEHKYETDSLLDGGYIEYSCDYGQNWRIVNSQYDFLSWGMDYYNYLDFPGANYPTIHDSIPAFTGTINDWEWTGLRWFPFVFKTEDTIVDCSSIDTIYIRFTFESDSVDNNKSGWMIRNIIIATTDQWGSVQEYSSQPIKLFPNPVTEKISFQLPPNAGKVQGVKILDVAGRTSSFTHASVTQIDVSNLSPGIYFMLIETEELIYRQRFLKQ